MNALAITWAIIVTVELILVAVWVYRNADRHDAGAWKIEACACSVKGVKPLRSNPKSVGRGIGLIWIIVALAPLLLTQPNVSASTTWDSTRPWAVIIMLLIAAFTFYVTVYQFLLFLSKSHTLKCSFRRMALGLMFLPWYQR